MHPNGYYFSRPIYMHKFTSRDVPSDRGHYNEKATEIEVQQSHSYEIKPESIPYDQSESKHHQQQQVYEDPVPVIVLKVPGPSKYALHLQALLQQYLEIRAAQFLKVIEEQDKHGQLMSPQHYATAPQEHVAYIPMIAITPMYHQNYYHQQNGQYRQHQQQQQYYHHHHHHHPQMYQQISVGQQSYYRHHPQMHRHHHHQQQQQQQQVIHYPKYVQQQPQPIPIYHQPQQQIHPSTFIAYVTPSYNQESHHQDSHDDDPLPTSENYPSEKHTHVIFKKKKTRVQNHPQPSITYHTDEPIIVPDHPTPIIHYKHPEPEEVYVSHPEEYQVTHQPTYSNHRPDHKEVHHIAAATDRSKGPYNYHVASTLAPTSEELHERHNPKRMVTVAPFNEKGNRMVEKTKRNRGSTRMDSSNSQLKEEKKI